MEKDKRFANTRDEREFVPPPEKDVEEFKKSLIMWSDKRIITVVAQYTELVHMYEFPPNRHKKHEFWYNVYKSVLVERQIPEDKLREHGLSDYYL